MNRHIRTSHLDIEIEEIGPTGGFPVILLHGFPDSARSWNGVSKRLVGQDLRIIIPSLRGFGHTKFCSALTPRNGQTAAFASDLIELVEALELERFMLVGHDIGASAAMLATPLLTEKTAGLILLAPNFYGSSKDGPRAFDQAQAYWYQWYFCTAVGRKIFASDPTAFCRELWRSWSPGWAFDDAEFKQTAHAFSNPDFLDVIMHFYRYASGEAVGDQAYDEIERRAKAVAQLHVPTIVLHGAADACTLPASSCRRNDYFVGDYTRKILPDIGHFIQREAPEAVADAIVELMNKVRLN